MDPKERFMQITVEKLKFSYQSRQILSINEGRLNRAIFMELLAIMVLVKQPFSRR